MATTADRIASIIVDLLGVDGEQVTTDASFRDDLGADSLDLVELIMAFEEEFSQDGQPMEISDEDAEKITTVQAAVGYLKGNGIQDT